MTSGPRESQTSSAPRADLLEAIVAATRHAVRCRERERPRADLERESQRHTPRGDAFKDALAGAAQVRVIAECKRRSPSRGVLRSRYLADEISRSYENAGAVAISVLTEPTFFDGSREDLSRVREAVTVPVLCKDFVVTEYQVVEARAIGADAVLLIAAALDWVTLCALLEITRSLGLAALVEVHSESELSAAIESGAEIVGVNNRNLRTLEVDLDVSFSLIEGIPDDVVAVAESGLRNSRDLIALRRVGYDAFLIGESLITQPDPGHVLRVLIEETDKLSRSRRTDS